MNKLGFDPEGIAFSHIRADRIESGLAGAHDYLVVVRVRHGTHAGLELADKEVIPRLKPKWGALGS